MKTASEESMPSGKSCAAVLERARSSGRQLTTCGVLEQRVPSGRLKDTGEGATSTSSTAPHVGSHAFGSLSSSGVHGRCVSLCQLIVAERVDEHGCGWVIPLTGMAKTAWGS